MGASPGFLCQFFSTPFCAEGYGELDLINCTLTHFADRCEQFSHDAINRYLRGERITPRLLWENVCGQVLLTPRDYVLFDDTVSTSSNQSSRGLRPEKPLRLYRHPS